MKNNDSSIVHSPGLSYEVITPEKLKPNTKLAGGVRPREVSGVAESRTVTQVDTRKGRRRVAYTLIPKDLVIYGRKNNARVLSEAPTPGVLSWMKKMVGVKQREIGLVRPADDDNPNASPELVVSEQSRIPLAEGRYAFMGDGSVMGMDGEKPLVEQFVQKQPGKFPPSAQAV